MKSRKTCLEFFNNCTPQGWSRYVTKVSIPSFSVTSVFSVVKFLPPPEKGLTTEDTKSTEGFCGG
jgi:hypothetical protein